MGGIIGITVREEDGSEHRMCRWTNLVPSFVCSSGLLDCNKDHLSKYLAAWYEAVDEYKQGIEDHGMIDPSHPYLAPIDYGLVVIDYKTKHVFHLQGYSKLDSLYPLDILSAKNDFGEWCLNDIKKMHADGRFKKIESMEDDGIKKYDISDKSFQDILHLCKNRKYLNWIKVDIHPWKITRYKESVNGLDRFKKKVISMGFHLTEEEERLWNEYRNKYE